MGLANATRGGSVELFTPLRSEMQRQDVRSRPHRPRYMGEAVGSDPVPEGAVRGRLSAVSCGGLIILVTHSRQSLGILNVLVSSRRSHKSRNSHPSSAYIHLSSSPIREA